MADAKPIQIRDKRLQIPLSAEEMSRIEAAATADHLQTATWVRQTLLEKIEGKK